MKIDRYNNEKIKVDIEFLKRTKLLTFITDRLKNGCIRCGQCCTESNPAVLFPEIRHYLDKDKDILVWDERSECYRIKKIEKEIGNQKGDICYYFDYVNKKGIKMGVCKTQNYKPVSCKIYPFSFGHNDLGLLSLVFCPMGAEIWNQYNKWCDSKIRIDKIKLLGEDREKTRKASEIFNKEFGKGGDFSIYDVIVRINEAKDDNGIIDIKPAIPIEWKRIEEFAMYLKRNIEKL